jgi:hypothetical protein
MDTDKDGNAEHCLEPACGSLYTSEVDCNQTSMIDDLRFKLNPSLQNALVHVPDPTDIYEFARTCQRVDQRLKDIQAVQAPS